MGSLQNCRCPRTDKNNGSKPDIIFYLNPLYHSKGRLKSFSDDLSR
ncbi:hypothetical protein NEIMUCOT_05107 [Neisseria mucosa ATCC 25996]|uniref:Uncharacterized protein n=1 Tax=Neisseria mucosa (strain ATCC 25996 / DSM 4631 / NCTC 10774 / M26) TaxID=546266 RepID=D2ZWV9_NEIM2|nr:hypothetical protein NEIMUCOT_05107 [Neisseria mucosa ATCC 25996]